MALQCIANDVFLSLCAFTVGEKGTEDKEVDGPRESASPRSTNSF